MPVHNSLTNLSRPGVLLCFESNGLFLVALLIWSAVTGKLSNCTCCKVYQVASDTLPSMSWEIGKGNLDTPSTLLCLSVDLNSGMKLGLEPNAGVVWRLMKVFLL